MLVDDLATTVDFGMRRYPSCMIVKLISLLTALLTLFKRDHGHDTHRTPRRHYNSLA